MKKIKKSVKFLLALTIFLSTGAPALANQDIQYPTPDANIPVSSHIGAFDNTDPDQIGPPDPNHPTWLNISVPSAVMFSSGGANGVGNDHTVLGSPNFTITNHSGRGVNVTVNGFAHTNAAIAPITDITALSITSAGALINGYVSLIDASGLIPVPSYSHHFMTIERVPTQGGETTATFAFSGSANAITGVAIAPSFELVLGFAVNGAH